MTKGKSVREQPSRDDASALENQLGLCAHEERADLEQPFRRGQTEGHAAGAPQHAHELAIRQRIWRRDVDDARQMVAADQPRDGGYEVLVVDPRHELPAVAGLAAETSPYQGPERIEHTVRIWTQRHGRTQRDLPRAL